MLIIRGGDHLQLYSITYKSSSHHRSVPRWLDSPQRIGISWPQVSLLLSAKDTAPTLKGEFASQETALRKQEKD
jgi:hypothetical protein